MSRLQKHQKKQFIMSMFFYLILLVIVLYFIMTFGFRLLLNVSIFIANLNNKSNNQSTSLKTEEFIGNIEIDSIPSATNSAKIIVTGISINFDELVFYINAEDVKKLSLPSDNFSEEIGDLKIGENEIYIIAKNIKSKKEKKSKIYTVIYKAEKPKLEIKEPQDQAKVTKQDLQVIGSTDAETYIRVNDFPVVVDTQGNFVTSIKLSEGENKITIVAQDIAGNNETKTLTITYQKED